MDKVNWIEFDTYIKVNNKDFDNLLYLHAFTGNWKNKQILFNKLNNVNFYCFNMPGHGNTKINNENEVNVKHYAELAIQFILDHDLNNIILFGHSMGGGIAMMICNDNRIVNRIKKIILEAPANNASKENFDLIKQLIPNTLKQMEMIGYELFYDPIKFFGNENNFNRFIQNEFNRLSKQQYLKNIITKESQDEFNQLSFNGIKNNNIKTLLILGGEDKIIPYIGTCKTFESHNNCQIVKIENAKHVPISEKFEICFNIIDDFINN